MSENFPGNPWADVHSEVKKDVAGVMSSLHLLAYEQRTANLIALLGELDRKHTPLGQAQELLDQILNRLGLDWGHYDA